MALEGSGDLLEPGEQGVRAEHDGLGLGVVMSVDAPRQIRLGRERIVRSHRQSLFGLEDHALQEEHRELPWWPSG